LKNIQNIRSKVQKFLDFKNIKKQQNKRIFFQYNYFLF